MQINTRKGEVTWLMSYFYYEVEHFKCGPSRSFLSHVLPEEMGEVEKYFSNGRTIKETDSDWQLEQWEQYFYR